MGKHLSTSLNIARVVVTLICLICFVLQSHQEIEKFFSNITSVSTRYTSGKEANIRLPRFVICAAEPFKSDKFPETLDEYLNLTYSQEELIYNFFTNGSQWVKRDYKVTEIATFYYGRCYVVEALLPVVIVGLNITEEAIVYFIDYGQELCIINSLQYCDVLIPNIRLKSFLHDIKVEAHKTIKEER